MGALKGSASFLTLVVTDELPAFDVDNAENHINLRRFVPLTPESEAIESSGWAPFEAPYESDLAILRDRFIFGGDLVCLAFRSDVIKLSTSLVNHEVEQRCRIVAEETGEAVDRQMKATIKLAVVAELRCTATPKTTIVEAIWRLSTGKIRVFGSAKQADDFAGIFGRTFDLVTRLDSFADMAAHVPVTDGARELMATLSPQTAFNHNIIRED